MFSCHGSEAGDEHSSVSTLGKSLHNGPKPLTFRWCEPTATPGGQTSDVVQAPG